MFVSAASPSKLVCEAASLIELEERLKFVTTPKLEFLCSCSFLPHTEEPNEMTALPHLWKVGKQDRRAHTVSRPEEYDHPSRDTQAQGEKGGHKTRPSILSLLVFQRDRG